MTVDEDAPLFEVYFITRKYKENIRDLINRKADGDDFTQYARGGLVSQEDLKNAGMKITQGLRNKSWAEYLLALEQQKKNNVSPGWQGYRRKYAKGGEVISPLQGLKQSILNEIDGMTFNWKGGLAKKSIINFY